jgi:hypothetical protein
VDSSDTRNVPGGGQNSTVFVAAVDWLLQRDANSGAYVNLQKPAVANFSGYFDYIPVAGADLEIHTTDGMTSVDVAASKLVSAGVFFTASANNQNDAKLTATFGGTFWTSRNSRACDQSPARAPRVVTVGGVDQFDQAAVWTYPNIAGGGTSTIGSNTGPCVSIYAPAVNLRLPDLSSDNQYGYNCKVINTSCDPTDKPTISNTAYRQMHTSSGSSFAAPLVAGAAALYLQSHTTASPATVRDFLEATATQNVVTKSGLLVPRGHVLFSKFAPIHKATPTTLGETTITLTGSAFSSPRVVFGTTLLPTSDFVGTPTTSSITFLKPSSIPAASGFEVSVINGSDFPAYEAGLQMQPPRIYVTSKLARGVVGGFNDIVNHSRKDAILTIAKHRITGGCGSGNYCPDAFDSNGVLIPWGQVTRAQMAIFLLRGSHGSSYLPPACDPATQRFADMPSSSAYCPWVEELAREGITGGCGNGNYCPNDPILRQQMAVFISRAKMSNFYTPPSTGVVHHFTDVPTGTAYYNYIQDLKPLGIDTVGCGSIGNPLFCPSLPLSRAEMAEYLVNAFDLQCSGEKACE